MAKALRLLRGFEDVDSFPPWSFGLEEVSSSLGVPSVPRAGVVAALSALGFRCGIQPFEKEGLKTDAPYEEVVRACVEAAARS